MNVFHVTISWYIESDAKLIPRSFDNDAQILEVLRHRLNGTPCCSTCPTRTPGDYTIVKSYNHDKNPGIYMSIDSIDKQIK